MERVIPEKIIKLKNVYKLILGLTCLMPSTIKHKSLQEWEL